MSGSLSLELPEKLSTNFFQALDLFKLAGSEDAKKIQAWTFGGDEFPCIVYTNSLVLDGMTDNFLQYHMLQKQQNGVTEDDLKSTVEFLQEIVKNRKLEDVVDIANIQKSLHDKDVLFATVLSIASYGTGDCPPITGPDGKADWGINSHGVRTEKALYIVPCVGESKRGYFSSLRQTQQSLSAFTGEYKDEKNPDKWIFGKDALNIAISDSEIIKAYAINHQRILGISQSLKNSRQSIHELINSPNYIPYGHLREPSSTFQNSSIKPDFSTFFQHHLSNYSITQYWKKCGIEITDDMASLLKMSDYLNVINPYDILAVGKTGTQEAAKTLLLEYKELFKEVRHGNKRNNEFDEWNVSNLFSIIRIIEPEISLEEVQSHTLIRNGWLHPTQIGKFYGRTIDGDFDYYKDAIKEFSNLVTEMQSQEISR